MSRPLGISDFRDPTFINRWAREIHNNIKQVEKDHTIVAQAVTNLAAHVTLSAGAAPFPTNVVVTANPILVDQVHKVLVTATYNGPNPLNGFSGVFLVT